MNHTYCFNRYLKRLPFGEFCLLRRRLVLNSLATDICKFYSRWIYKSYQTSLFNINCQNALKFFRTLSSSYTDENVLDVSDESGVKKTFKRQFENEVLSLDEIYQHIIDENGRDVCVIKLPKSVNYVDYFIVVTANSPRHLVHLAESLNRLHKQRKSPSDPFRIIEGKRTSKDWQCINLGNSVVHFMLEQVREKYELEKLWVFGPKFDEHLRQTPSIQEVMEKVADEGLILLSKQPSSSERVDDIEIVNPWEMDYSLDDKPLEKWDEDEDAYII